MILKGFLTFSVGGFVYTILDKYDGIQDGKWTICQRCEESSMDNKTIIVIAIIIISIILNEIFTSLELKWYIQLAPFAIAILGYLFIEMRSRIK